MLTTHLFAGQLHHALHPAQYGKRQNNSAELGVHGVAVQHVGHVTDEIGEVVLVYATVPYLANKEGYWRVSLRDALIDAKT